MSTVSTAFPARPARPGAPRVVVVGGGVLGASTAAHLVRAGARVDLVTEAAIASGASGRSLSWLNSAGARSDAYHRLRTVALDRYRTFAARTGLSDRVRFDGGLTWAAPGESHRERHAHELSIGYDSVWLSRDEVAAWAPGVDVTAVAEEGAVFNPGEGWVDLPLLVEALLEQVRAAGGEVHTGTGRARPVLTGGRATGVATASGRTFAADAVVWATGPRVPRDLAGLAVHLPESSPVSLLLETQRIEHPLRAVLNTPRVAIRPTPHGTFVLDSGWSEQEVVVRGDGEFEVRGSTVTGLLDEASRVLAGNPRLEAARRGVGPKPIPGDGEPVAGELREVPGLHVLFTHSGATLGLVLGEFTAREVLGERVALLEPFRPERFTATAR
ncbi:FAD-binding oxidoreductase [Paenibacillus sp. TRM 82003]|uniref:NAD(P)/FAD-dependent oxidoreductase n=1 Tax=Kineococcus sp. TRM81007 TaxID=2925831 RepID=UPI001F590E51|nr:FAD-binding oxidoreductase [Kineococcus sp. TRM81007]MCI2237113.1 FAD-binding oxidoreductase [Kineococcus sp. TRM81007]MCI3926416.1 FAD-binding oxidoreductase [Paenibacillus sp. TRM 82003]